MATASLSTWGFDFFFPFSYKTLIKVNVASMWTLKRILISFFAPFRGV